MKYLITATLLMCLAYWSLSAQSTILRDYKKGKIILKTGATLQGTSISINQEQVKYKDPYTNQFITARLSDIDYLDLRYGNTTLKGAIWGGAIGLVFPFAALAISQSEVEFIPGGVFIIPAISFATIGGIIGAISPKRKIVENPSKYFAHRPQLQLGITQNGIGFMVNLN